MLVGVVELSAHSVLWAASDGVSVLVPNGALVANLWQPQGKISSKHPTPIATANRAIRDGSFIAQALRVTAALRRRRSR